MLFIPPLISGAFALISGPSREIDTIIPHVTVREVHRDEMAITHHPVERGAAIADHAFMQPQELEMAVGWSDSAARMPNFIIRVYAELLALQVEREPFSIFTGKREYENMLMVGLIVTTDEKTENILACTARFREVIIVRTKTTQAPKSAQSNPQNTFSSQAPSTRSAAPAASAPTFGPPIPGVQGPNQ